MAINVLYDFLLKFGLLKTTYEKKVFETFKLFDIASCFTKQQIFRSNLSSTVREVMQVEHIASLLNKYYIWTNPWIIKFWIVLYQQDYFTNRAV